MFPRGRQELAGFLEGKEVGRAEGGPRLSTHSENEETCRGLKMKRLAGAGSVVTGFRVTQPPWLSCFLELSMTSQPTPRKYNSHQPERAEPSAALPTQ